ncbi:MAG: helix-turn-helix transcriptional regulator, partial [Ruminococcus sp.]|nr:helix-turn-helix transcriptional regulator [Ruminococcus sp.]
MNIGKEVVVKMLTGQKIAKIRTKVGLTQEQLAQKLYVTRTMV